MSSGIINNLKENKRPKATDVLGIINNHKENKRPKANNPMS